MLKRTIQHEPVFCLHIRKYRETSAILDCFSQNFGRISLVAKGVYRKKSNFDIPSYFQAYQLSGILKSELGILTGLEKEYSWPKLLGKKWFVACYMNELLLKLVPKQENVEKLYASYVETLHVLGETDDYHNALLVFEKRLLEVLGYGINLLTQSRNEEELATEQYYQYHPVHGFVSTQSGETNAISGRVINALENEDFDYFTENNESFSHAKRIIRMALKQQLAGVSLKTVQVMQDVNSFTIEETLSSEK